MTKGLIVTRGAGEYKAFLARYKLNPTEYPLVSRPEAIYGYRDLPAICITTWWQIVTWQMEDYMKQHNIDMITL